MSEINLTERLARAESRIDALERLYNQLRQDVSELRGEVGQLRSDMSDLKDRVNNIQIEQARGFAEIKDLIGRLMNKALSSLPPWGAVLTILLGAMVGTVVGLVLSKILR